MEVFGSDSTHSVEVCLLNASYCPKQGLYFNPEDGDSILLSVSYHFIARTASVDLPVFLSNSSSVFAKATFYLVHGLWAFLQLGAQENDGREGYAAHNKHHDHHEQGAKHLGLVAHINRMLPPENSSLVLTQLQE
jgi:hypothetical protein